MLRGVIAASALGPLFALTVLAQLFESVRTRTSRRVSLRVVPSWHFFGPIPAIADVHLLCRARSQGNDPGPWTEIPIASQQRGRALWNPDRFPDKALHDLTNSLISSCTKLRRQLADIDDYQRGRQLTLPYVALLQWVVDSATQAADGEQRQFAIVRSIGHQGRLVPEVVFVSEFHSVR